MAKNKKPPIEMSKQTQTESRSRAKRINSLADQLYQIEDQQSRHARKIRNELDYMGKTNRSFESRIRNDDDLSDTLPELNKTVGKLNRTIDTITTGMLRITKGAAEATSEAISQYGRAVAEDFSINKTNMVAMSLAHATPIFGYFAAKFVETDIFKKAREKMSENLKSGMSKIFSRQKEIEEDNLDFLQDSRSRIQNERKNIDKELSYVRSNKFKTITEKQKQTDSKISSINKLERNRLQGSEFAESRIYSGKSSRRISPINTEKYDQFKTVKSEQELDRITKSLIDIEDYVEKTKKPRKSILKDFVIAFKDARNIEEKTWQQRLLKGVLELKVGLIGMTNRFQLAWTKTLMQHPTLRRMVVFGQLMDKAIKAPFQFLFGARGGYAGDVKRATSTSNVFLKISNLLSLIYSKSMIKYDKIIHILEQSTGISSKDVKDKNWFMFDKLKKWFSGERDKRPIKEKLFSALLSHARVNQDVLADRGIKSFKDLDPRSLYSNIGAKDWVSRNKNVPREYYDKGRQFADDAYFDARWKARELGKRGKAAFNRTRNTARDYYDRRGEYYDKGRQFADDAYFDARWKARELGKRGKAGLFSRIVNPLKRSYERFTGSDKPRYRVGGIIPETGSIIAHKGEMILPVESTLKALTSAKKGTAGLRQKFISWRTKRAKKRSKDRLEKGFDDIYNFGEVMATKMDESSTKWETKLKKASDRSSKEYQKYLERSARFKERVEEKSEVRLNRIKEWHIFNTERKRQNMITQNLKAQEAVTNKYNKKLEKFQKRLLGQHKRYFSWIFDSSERAKRKELKIMKRITKQRDKLERRERKLTKKVEAIKRKIQSREDKFKKKVELQELKFELSRKLKLTKINAKAEYYKQKEEMLKQKPLIKQRLKDAKIKAKDDLKKFKEAAKKAKKDAKEREKTIKDNIKKLKKQQREARIASIKQKWQQLKNAEIKFKELRKSVKDKYKSSIDLAKQQVGYLKKIKINTESMVDKLGHIGRRMLKIGSRIWSVLLGLGSFVMKLGTNLFGKAFGAAKFLGGLGLRGAGALAGSATALGLGGVGWGIYDAFKGSARAKQWKTSRTSAAIGGFLGGANKPFGISGTLKGMGKGAMIGAGVGMFAGPLGSAIGGAIGALAGGILGFVGGENIAKSLDWMGGKIKNLVSAVWTFVKHPFVLLGKGIDWGKEKINAGMNTVMEAIKPYLNSSSNFLKSAFGKINEMFEIADTIVSESVIDAWEHIKGVWKDPRGSMEGAFKTAKNIFGTAKDFWKKKFDTMWEWISTKADVILEWFTEPIDTILEIFITAKDMLVDKIKSIPGMKWLLGEKEKSEQEKPKTIQMAAKEAYEKQYAPSSAKIIDAVSFSGKAWVITEDGQLLVDGMPASRGMKYSHLHRRIQELDDQITSKPVSKDLLTKVLETKSRIQEIFDKDFGTPKELRTGVVMDRKEIATLGAEEKNTEAEITAGKIGKENEKLTKQIKESNDKTSAAVVNSSNVMIMSNSNLANSLANSNSGNGKSGGNESFSSAQKYASKVTQCNVN